MSNWNELANTYESFSVREDSLDTLQDWPAQLDAVGDISELSILDIGCGSGRKALHFAVSGAKKVIGVDVSKPFIEAWETRDKPSNLEFYEGDISALEEVAVLTNQNFDLITCFMVLGYSTNIKKTIRFIRSKLKTGGRFVLTTAHPFRFAVEQFEQRGQKIGISYRQEGLYQYDSSWDKNISVSHQKPMISTCINMMISNGFRLDAMHEPDISPSGRRDFPHKAEWVDQYLGLVVYRLAAV